ncbi:hypothetical protein [Nostoc sp. FACHB-133]|uniref:hypothetical protein n=1 Tax=Nostoc sp. FACHB-133 TaxID=2692835 RepID=UPI001687924E|nr:hypothetical protein [Nostoc sp. FACHB-133]MBD2526231.1 hypothetical protein [Nostoc sp. FACHB-133]
MRSANIPYVIIQLLALECSPFVYAWSNPFLDFLVAGGNFRLHPTHHLPVEA